MYHVEIEQSDTGGMALRMFRYGIEGALLHNKVVTDQEVEITFPKPCVVFLKSTKNTPDELLWKIKFFDGQEVEVKVPTVKLSEMTVAEILQRNLFPIGQFLPRAYEPITSGNLKDFKKAVDDLLEGINIAMKEERIPEDLGLNMQDTIIITAKNAVLRSKDGEVEKMREELIEDIHTWTDYSKVFEERETIGRQEGEARGEARGEANAFIKIALNVLNKKSGDEAKKELLSIGVPSEMIEQAQQIASQQEKDRLKAKFDKATAKREHNNNGPQL